MNDGEEEVIGQQSNIESPNNSSLSMVRVDHSDDVHVSDPSATSAPDKLNDEEWGGDNAPQKGPPHDVPVSNPSSATRTPDKLNDEEWGDDTAPQKAEKAESENQRNSCKDDADETDDDDTTNDEAEVLREWGDDIQGRKGQGLTSEHRQSPSNSLKAWNTRIRQTPKRKSSLWQNVRWKNLPSPQRMQKAIVEATSTIDSLKEDQALSSSACEEDEDGLLVNLKEGYSDETSGDTKKGTQGVHHQGETMPVDPASAVSTKRTSNLQVQESSSTLCPPPPSASPSSLSFNSSPFGFQQMRPFAQLVKNQSSIESSNDFFQVKPHHVYPPEFRMNESELYHEMMRASECFEEVTSRSSGRQIGTLKVEVLSALGLAKFDRFSKPNAIAYLVCGDTAFATDAIPASLSPMWPARSRRAVEFPLFHAYAKLYLGIFNDTDKDVDDFAGRLAINVASLRQDIEYDVIFPLKVSTLVYDQRPRGCCRLRFTLHWSDERAAVLSYLPWKRRDLPWIGDSKSDFVAIPCADPKTLRNVAFVVHGEDLPGKFSRKAFR